MDPQCSQRGANSVQCFSPEHRGRDGNILDDWASMGGSGFTDCSRQQQFLPLWTEHWGNWGSGRCLSNAGGSGSVILCTPAQYHTQWHCPAHVQPKLCRLGHGSNGSEGFQKVPQLKKSGVQWPCASNRKCNVLSFMQIGKCHNVQTEGFYPSLSYHSVFKSRIKTGVLTKCLECGFPWGFQLLLPTSAVAPCHWWGGLRDSQLQTQSLQSLEMCSAV